MARFTSIGVLLAAAAGLLAILQTAHPTAAATVPAPQHLQARADAAAATSSVEYSSESVQYSDEYSDESDESAHKASSIPLNAAQVCDPKLCRPPACRCSSTNLVEDGSIPLEQIPQMVMLTFDDAVTALNYDYVDRAINGRTNPDGCPAAATFFVSHDYTDYSKVHALWADGHEIALHSITHNHMASHWKNITVDGLMAEFGEQMDIMEHFAKINRSEIRGMRLPLFELSGNNSFEAIRRLGMEYDSSWPSQHYISPGMWPYSLEYRSIQDCPIGKCPSASMPDVWVNPILDWVDTHGFKCPMVDACGYM